MAGIKLEGIVDDQGRSIRSSRAPDDYGATQLVTATGSRDRRRSGEEWTDPG